MSDWSTDDPTSPYFGASTNYGSTPQGILDYSNSTPQYQSLFGNAPTPFGMSPQWRDFLYLTGAALRDYGNRGRTDTFGNSMNRLQELNWPRVGSDGDYQMLPSGTVYVGPDGRLRRKP